MKKHMRIAALGFVALLFASSVDVAAQTATQKTRAFFQNNKRKLLAGVAAAAVLGTAIGLAWHTDKTMTAIEKAGMKPSDDLFAQAVAAVGLLGPLGMERTMSLLKMALLKNVISADQALSIVSPPIGLALANYWGVNYAVLATEAAAVGLKVSTARVARVARKKVDQAVGALKRFVSDNNNQ